MTIGNLKRLCELWKRRLRITDWTTPIRWAKEGELLDACGTAPYDPRNMTAEIVIRDTQDAAYPDGGVESTLIHELLHLVMHGNVDYEAENIMQERAINQIADALYWSYQTKRRTKKAK